MRSILITGCNRGLGLGMVKNLTGSKNPPEIFATCRDIQKATELNELAKQHKNIHIVQIDITDFKSYPTVVKKVQDVMGNQGLNVLFNNAGVSTKFTRLPLVKDTQLIEGFQVNLLAPILLTKALLPQLKQAATNYQDKNAMSISRAAVINMTSILASIGSNDAGGFYPYRCSKSGLNAATKSMSVDLKGDKILVVSMHPGWVKTDLGGPQAPLDVETSVSNMLRTLQSLTEKDTGSFLQHDGKKLPW